MLGIRETSHRKFYGDMSSVFPTMLSERTVILIPSKVDNP